MGYTGTVFEPIDEYKGDFARAYFYMSVRYYGEDSNWGSSGMTNKSEIEDWAMTMLLNWHNNDPVSQKEIDRNNVIYNSYQHNRNPFIDHPEYAGMIWNSEPIPDVFEGEFTPYTADIVEGDYIIIYNGHALTNTISSNKLTSTDVNTQNEVITNPSRSIVWHIAKISNTNYWTIKNDAVNQYAAGTDTKNQMALVSSVTNYAKWTPTCSNNVFEFENYGRSIASSYSDNKWLRCNTDSNNAWAPYSTSTGGTLTLYKYEPVVPAQVEYAYSINGVLGSPQQITQGESIVSLPSGTNLSSDYTFAGWTDNLSDIENNIHAAGTAYQVDYDVVLYAVYAHQIGGTPTISYNKVTSAPSDWSGALKLVHLLPMVFTVGVITLILIAAVARAMIYYDSSNWHTWYWICLAALAPIVLYSLIIFIHSSIKNKSLKVGLLSIPAAFVQLMGYGLGFIESWWKRCVLKKDEFQAFEKNFYS